MTLLALYAFNPFRTGPAHDHRRDLRPASRRVVQLLDIHRACLEQRGVPEVLQLLETPERVRRAQPLQARLSVPFRRCSLRQSTCTSTTRAGPIFDQTPKMATSPQIVNDRNAERYIW